MLGNFLVLDKLKIYILYTYQLIIVKREAKMSQYIPNFYWTFNCSPGPNDYDYNANWGEITIQRTNLQYKSYIAPLE